MSEALVKNLKTIETLRFGTLEIKREDVWFFPAGLPGLEEYHEFVLVRTKDEHVVWLQSLAEGTLALPLTEPWWLVPDYEVVLTTADTAALQLKSAEEAVVFLVLNLRGTPSEWTANLLAPVVMNLKKHLGCQVVMERSKYGCRGRLLDLPGAKDLLADKEAFNAGTHSQTR
jgi:flagellar assembly factor FliW